MQPQRNSKLVDAMTPDSVGLRKPWPNRARQMIDLGLFAVFLSVAGAAPVMAAPLQLPTLVVPASEEHHIGKVVFVD